MSHVDIDLQLACSAPNVPSEADFQRWVSAALAANQLDQGELSIRLVDTEESQALNHQYRGKEKPTNVLSFPFEQPEGIDAPELAHLLGDLIICSSVVQQEADEQEKPALHHWAHMVIHGTLHLLGYDHINDDDAEEMESLERTILASLNIPDPYQGENEV